MFRVCVMDESNDSSSGFILRFLFINALAYCMKLQGVDIVFESLVDGQALDSASCTILDSASCTILIFFLVFFFKHGT